MNGPGGKSSGSKDAGRGFDVSKSGDTRIGLVGFPSVGKSTLLTALTGTASEAAAYEFTTLTCIPGTMTYRGARVQVLDLPGIIEGAADGKGRGRQVSGHREREGGGGRRGGSVMIYQTKMKCAI